MKGTVKKNTAGSRAIPLLTALVLLTVIGAIAMFAYVSRIEDHGEKYLARVYEQQVLGQKIAKYALEASAGDQASFALLRQGSERFSALMDELKNGAPDVDLPPSPASAAPAWRAVSARSGIQR